MSWVEDEGFDAFEPPEPPDERDIRDKDIWVDGQGVAWEWDELETEHIHRIIIGLNNGKTYWNQKHKLERAMDEVTSRESKS